MESGRRSEIVRSDGFRFGNRRLWAACQSTNRVESCLAQKSRSSSSERNSGICFFMLPINLLLSAIHVSNRYHADQQPPNGEGGKQIPSSIRLSESIVPLLPTRMADISANHQRLAVEDIFGFFPRVPMLLPILLTIRVI